MGILSQIAAQIRPSFLTRTPNTPVTGAYLFNYRRLWWFSILTMAAVALVPLLIISIVNYKVTEKGIESEYRLRTARSVSNSWRAISFFLTERRAALDFIVHDNALETLSDSRRLADVLANLKRSFGGGFVDLGVVDAGGHQHTYVGPYGLENREYRDQPWFREVSERGVFISDVFLGFRQVPHLVIAVKQDLAAGDFFVLRASIGIGPFEDLLANLELSGQGDAFIINRDGILQTPSHYHGGVLQAASLPPLAPAAQTEVVESTTEQGVRCFIGYRFIEDSPFILVIVKNKTELLKPWYRIRLELIVFTLISISVILAVILGTVTLIVGRVHLTDEKRLATLHQMEYANKMATIGRMAASVAHEINNPLAIINEKAGLIKDLFTLRPHYAPDPKLNALVDSILASVQRAGRITKRLLTFARNLVAKTERVDMAETINEILSFVERDAAYRNIEIRTEIGPGLDALCMDRGKLQQVILNIVNNAFAAMAEGGRLDLNARREGSLRIRMDICDNGCGIPPEDVQRIFEPFFSTKKGQGGTGLGLSITYALVQELDGTIAVTSTVGQGTCFSLTLPFKAAGECDPQSTIGTKEPPCASSWSTTKES
jgi:signal transduction histidine kinase